MALIKRVGTSGRDYYESLYASELQQEAEWLRRSAACKVDSIETLLARHSVKPRAIMELGCGTGAVIRECRRRGLAQRYIGVDYSADAIAYLRTNAPEIEAIQADISSPDLRIDETIDVLVLTHVIEHLDDPHDFLKGIIRKLKFTYIVAEVPLENLLVARLKRLVKDRRINVSGHVQFFTPSSFENLLTTHALKVLDRRTYIPIHSLDTIRFLQAKDGLSPLGVSRMIAASVLIRAFYPFWVKLYYSHYAVLCSQSDAAAPAS